MRLTFAETETLRLLVESPGLTSKQLARRLCLSKRGVDWRLERLYARLGIEGRWRGKRDQAVERARELGLVEK